MGRLQRFFERMRCRMFHVESWSLYGGFQRPFVYCCHCNRIYGDEASWEGQAVGYNDADLTLRGAAVMASFDPEIRCEW